MGAEWTENRAAPMRPLTASTAPRSLAASWKLPTATAEVARHSRMSGTLRCAPISATSASASWASRSAAGPLACSEHHTGPRRQRLDEVPPPWQPRPLHRRTGGPYGHRPPPVRPRPRGRRTPAGMSGRWPPAAPRRCGSRCRCAGLVPITALAGQRGLAALADEHLSVPNDKGAKPGSGCRNGRYGGMWSHGESISLGDESLELMCATVPRRLVAVSSWSGYL